jgi:hypothetical protein
VSATHTHTHKSHFPLILTFRSFRRTIERLANEIASLQSEQTRYTENWTSRREAFDGIVRDLESLGQIIRDEKEDQERRQALDEDDDDTAEVVAVVGGASGTAAQLSTEQQQQQNQGSAAAAGGGALNPVAKAFQPTAAAHLLSAAALVDSSSPATLSAASSPRPTTSFGDTSRGPGTDGDSQMEDGEEKEGPDDYREADVEREEGEMDTS